MDEDGIIGDLELQKDAEDAADAIANHASLFDYQLTVCRSDGKRFTLSVWTTWGPLESHSEWSEVS